MILDIGFCVLKGLIELRKVGVLAGDLIKKRRYWPNHIKGDMIDTNFQEKNVGKIDSWNSNLNNTPYNIFYLKELYYSMKIMATNGELNFPEGQWQSKRVAQKDDG